MKKKIRGYFQVPNSIFELGLSKHELLVLMNLMRRANRLKGRTCFPSIGTISRNCGMKSETTVREALGELINKKLISKKEKTGRSNEYKISKQLYKPIDEANGIDNNNNELDDTPSLAVGVDNEVEEIATTPSHIDGTPSLAVWEPPRQLYPNKSNLTKLKNKKKEKEKEKEKSTAGLVHKENTSARGTTNTFAETNRYYQFLTERGKDAFEIGGMKLLRPGELDPRYSLVSNRNIRCRYFVELLEIHAARVEGTVFTIPAETQPPSEPP